MNFSQQQINSFCKVFEISLTFSLQVSIWFLSLVSPPLTLWLKHSIMLATPPLEYSPTFECYSESSVCPLNRISNISNNIFENININNQEFSHDSIKMEQICCGTRTITLFFTHNFIVDISLSIWKQCW